MALTGNFVDGAWVEATSDHVERKVTNPWDGTVLGAVCDATDRDIDTAVAAAERAPRLTPLAPYRRYEILSAAAVAVAAEHEQLARLISSEAGKPIRDARGEVTRSVQALQLCAEEAKRRGGEVVPMDASPGSEHRVGFTIPTPIGPVCAITSFNAPLIQIMHKVPAALAAGCPAVLKPSEATPLTAIRFVELLNEAGLPPGWVNLLHGDASLGEKLIADPRFGAYTFTGSVRVGKRIQATVGLRKAVLELGNNSPSIVHHDADLDVAAKAVAKSAFVFAGQMCISAQRLLVHRSVRDEFLAKLTAAVDDLVVGDPLDEATDVGPMINSHAVERTRQLVASTVASGGSVLTGGETVGNTFTPTILDDVRVDMQIACEEAFAPVLAVLSYETLEEALELANGTPYGLQAALFTESIDVALHVGRNLQTGTVMVNEGSHVRLDQAPFGGVKDSGLGREGIRYAVEEFTVPRLVCLNLKTPV